MIFYVLLVISVVVGFFVAFIMADESDHLLGKILSAVFGFIIGTGLGVGFSLLIAMVVGSVAGTDERDGENIELQAINMGSGVKGSFFLGTGYVDDELTYSYYAKNDDGSFSVDSIDAEEATIVETDDTPHIQVVKRYFKSWVSPEWIGEWGERYVIYVPTGSIKPMIDMDLPE